MDAQVAEFSKRIREEQRNPDLPSQLNAALNNALIMLLHVELGTNTESSNSLISNLIRIGISYDRDFSRCYPKTCRLISEVSLHYIDNIQSMLNLVDSVIGGM